MSWQLKWTPRALRDAEKLSTRDSERVLAALERLAYDDQGDVKRLQGREREWRLRVGPLRVRLTYDYASGTIEVLRILPRGRAYR